MYIHIHIHVHVQCTLVGLIESFDDRSLVISMCCANGRRREKKKVLLLTNIQINRSRLHFSRKTNLNDVVRFLSQWGFRASYWSRESPQPAVHWSTFNLDFKLNRMSTTVWVFRYALKEGFYWPDLDAEYYQF